MVFTLYYHNKILLDVKSKHGMKLYFSADDIVCLDHVFIFNKCVITLLVSASYSNIKTFHAIKLYPTALLNMIDCFAA